MNETTADLMEAAWGLIANASGGDWTKASPEWRDAAERFRARYFAWQPEHRAGLSPIARTEIETVAEAMRRVVNQQMVVTPLDTQNLSDETRKVGKMLCYQIDKWRAALDSVLGAESTKEGMWPR